MSATEDSATSDSLVRLRREVARALSDPEVTHGLARALRAATKELDLFANHRRSRCRYPSGQVDVVAPRVQIGGGTNLIDGFLNIDLTPPADIIWDVREGIPLSGASTEFVFSEHFLEHLDYPQSANRYCREVHRILKPGGQAVTGVPDAEFVLRVHRDADERAFNQMVERWYGNRACVRDIVTTLDLVNYAFRDQDDDPTYSPHLWAYDFDKLSRMFMAAGFASVEPWPFDGTLARPKRQWASLYVRARKAV